jgi:hypothetical protein
MDAICISRAGGFSTDKLRVGNSSRPFSLNDWLRDIAGDPGLTRSAEAESCGDQREKKNFTDPDMRRERV